MSHSRVTYSAGDVYEGSWNENGQKDGIGKLKFVDGSVYEGKFISSFFSGLGVLKLTDNSKYEGEFLNGKFHGFGVYTRHDGWIIHGQFEDGKVHGNGKITCSGTNAISIGNNEGFFECNKLTRREKSTESVMKAKRFAAQARLVKLNKNIARGVHH